MVKDDIDDGDDGEVVGGGEDAEEDGHLEDDGAVGYAAVVKDTGQQVDRCSERVGLGEAGRVR